MVDGVVTLQEWYGTMTDNIQRIDWQRKVFMRSALLYSDLLFMWDYGSLGKNPYTLNMGVGVGPTPEF